MLVITQDDQEHFLHHVNLEIEYFFNLAFFGFLICEDFLHIFCTLILRESLATLGVSPFYLMPAIVFALKQTQLLPHPVCQTGSLGP